MRVQIPSPAPQIENDFMARKLTFITSAISQYLISNFAKTKVVKQTISCVDGALDVPDVAYMAYMQGRAEFERKFVQHLFMKNISSSLSQLQIYRKMIENRQFFRLCMEKSGGLKYFSVSYSSNDDLAECCFVCFCILLAVSINKKDNLSSVLTSDFYNHFMPMVYSAPTKQDDINLLKKAISSELAKRWNKKVDIRESFNTDKQSVDFRLIAIVEGTKPLELIQTNGKRLKSTYLDLQERLKMEYFSFEL